MSGDPAVKGGPPYGGGGGGVGSEMLNVWGHRTHLADFFHVLCVFGDKLKI